MSLNAVLSLLFLFSVCNYVICVWIGFSYYQDFLRILHDWLPEVYRNFYTIPRFMPVSYFYRESNA